MLSLTPDQRQAIVRAYRGGGKIAAIAAEHGCSDSLVAKIARRHGLPPRPCGRSDADKQEIARMYRDGVPLRVIGEAFGISMAAADMARKHMGVSAYREKLRRGKGRAS